LSAELLLFLLYFVAVFGIGWYGLRLTRDEADYWIAGGKLGWVTGGATVAATNTSAGTFIGTIGLMYATGWSFIWAVLSIPLALWFTAAVLAPRFTRVRELTLPAFLERRYYGRSVRGISAVIILVAIIVYIQAQIVAGGLIANTVFGVPASWGMIGFTAILLIYTTVGGMFAVVYTDFFQLGIMVLGVVLALPLAVHQVGGPAQLLVAAQAADPRTFTWEGLAPSLVFTMGLAFMLGSAATPEKLVRLYAMRDMRTIRRGLLFAAIVITVINLIVGLLSLAARVLFPALPTGDLAMPMLARAVLPSALGGLMLAAIVAAMMSTVDSLLLIAGSALAHDIYVTLVNPKASPRQRTMVDRIGVVIVGVTPVVLVLSGVGAGTLVQLIVLLFSALMGASFFVPVALGVLWRRATRQGAIAAMLGGMATTFLWKAFGPAQTIDPILPGFLCSLALLVGVSLLTPPPPPEAVEPYFGGRQADVVAVEL
jgi:SSS family transporter